jgi:hypothetical protein
MGKDSQRGSTDKCQETFDSLVAVRIDAWSRVFANISFELCSLHWVCAWHSDLLMLICA